MSSIKCTASANDGHRLRDGEGGKVHMEDEIEYPPAASTEGYPSHSPPQHQKKSHGAAAEGSNAGDVDTATRGEPRCSTAGNERPRSSPDNERYHCLEVVPIPSTLHPNSSRHNSPPAPHHSRLYKSLLERGKSPSKEEETRGDPKVEMEAGCPGYPLHPSSFVGSAHSRMSSSLERSSQARDEMKKNNRREKVPRWKKFNRFSKLQGQESRKEGHLSASSSLTSTATGSRTLISSAAASSSLSCLPDEVGEEEASQSDQSVERANSSATQGGNDVEVPLITPRYQRRHRVVRRMNVTDSTPAVQKTSSLLHNRTTECMTIKQGPLEYTEKVHFQTYELFRHSKGRIHTRSVGYSEDGDFVMFREDLSQATDDVKAAVRRTAEIYNPTVLDPSAKAPSAVMDDASSSSMPSRQTKKKYPGIRAPRNKKIRNRLCNDFFASDVAKPILDQAREYEKEEEREAKEGMYSSKPIFCALPHPLDQGFDVQDAKDAKIAEKYWSQQRKLPPSPVDPNSPEARLQLLNTRLRAEVQRALSSKFLSQQMEDLEANFILFISSHNANTNNHSSTSGAAKKSLVFNFQNGYSRLICHGIATYYGLISQSVVINVAPGSQHSSPNILSSTNAMLPAQPPSSSSIASSRGGRGNDSTAATMKLTLVSFPQSSKKKRKVGKNKPLETSDTLLELPYIPLIQCLRPSSFSRIGVSTASTASSSPGLGPIRGEASSSMYFLPEEISSCSSLHLISESEEIGSSTLDLSPPRHLCAAARGEKDGRLRRAEKLCNDEAESEQDGSEDKNRKKKKQSVVGEWMEECAKEESGMLSSGVLLSHPFPPSARAQRSGTPLCSPISAVGPSLHTEPSAVQSMQTSPPPPHPSRHSYTPSPYIARSIDIPATPPSFSPSHSPQDWMSWGSCPSYNNTIRVVQGCIGGGVDGLNGCDIPPLYEPQLCLAPLTLGTPSFSASPSGSPSPPPLVLPPPATAVSSLPCRNGMSEMGKKLVSPATLVTMTNVNRTFRLADGVPPAVSLSPYKDFSSEAGSCKPEEGNKVKDEGGGEERGEGGGGTCGAGASFTVAEWMAIHEHLVALGLQIRPIGVSNPGRKNSQFAENRV